MGKAAKRSELTIGTSRQLKFSNADGSWSSVTEAKQAVVNPTADFPDVIQRSATVAVDQGLAVTDARSTAACYRSVLVVSRACPEFAGDFEP